MNERIEKSLAARIVVAGALSLCTMRARGASDVWIEATSLVPHTAQDGAAFGTSIHVNGDQAVIGVPFADAGVAADSGEIEVWHRAGAAWHFANAVVEEPPRAGVYFGYAVAIDADRLYVGAPAYDGGPPHGGLVDYLQYEADTGVWTSIGGMGGAEGDSTGSSIAYDHGLIAIGAPGPCTTCGSALGRAGKVQVAFNVDDFETYGTIYPDNDGADSDHFGRSVAIYRSPNVLEPDLAVVGAPNHDSGAQFAGAAYVFANATHGADGWQQVAYLTAPDPALLDLFGSAVAIGPGRVFVGAPGRDLAGASPIVDAGSVVVFGPDGSGLWQRQDEIFLPNPAASDGFGTAVAYGASHGRLIASAPNRAMTVFGGAGNTGVAAVFELRHVVGPIFAWVDIADLHSDDFASIGQRAGAALAIDGDRVYVGAPGYDANPNNGLTNSGRVLVFVADEIFGDGLD